MSVIIPRNSKLPIERSQRFFTAEDEQTYVFIQIFEGENFKKAKRNRLLGSFTIDGLPKKPKGQEHIDVTFRIDEEGILQVIGQTSIKSTNLTIKDNRGRISLEELEALRSQVC
jgi:molecular chaperone DnaK (HSP70)